MRTRAVSLFLCFLLLVTSFMGFGYAALNDELIATGEGELQAPKRVHISGVTPAFSGGVSVTGTSGTLFMASVTRAGSANFTITVTNPTSDVYVFERVIDGAETGVEGVYQGTAITYTVSGITPLVTEIPANGGVVTFTVGISVPSGVTAEQYALLFNFLPKGSVEILPDGTKYEVVFKPNNGDADRVIEVEKDKTVTRPADPVREGYTFTGWYKDTTLLVPWSFDTDTVVSNVMLYGGWRENAVAPPDAPEEPEVAQYEVVFEYYNGDPDYVIYVDEGSLVPKPADPTRSGYTFTGWYKDAESLIPWDFATETVKVSTMLHAGWKSNSSSGNENLVGDFAGLVIALLSPETSNGVNQSNVIYQAVRQALVNGKRPTGHAPILHCSVRSISGGTMSSVAESANAKLNNTLQFFFEAEPNDSNVLYLYMYYEKDIDAAAVGDRITVYKQVLTRNGSNADWVASGTYLGYATVGDFYGGGNNGKSVRTVDAYSWKAGVLTAEEG